MIKPKHLLISRTDSIGDVVLTLPVCGLLKERFPDCTITFLGNAYTLPLLEKCSFIDHTIDWNRIKDLEAGAQVKFFTEKKFDTIVHVFPKKEIAKIAKAAGIPNRVGTNRRTFHWFTCNHLVNLTRKNTSFHEAQLNIKLLEAFGITNDIPLTAIPSYYGLKKDTEKLPDFIQLNPTKKAILLHPKSKGSAREWGLDNFSKLIQQLPEDQFEIYTTGTETEGELYRSHLVTPFPGKVTDTSGKLSLSQLISFISKADAIVAASTGPLHIGAAMGIKAIGLYAPMRPIFPTRWAPLGKKAFALALNKKCSDCKKGGSCHCINEIGTEEVLRILNKND
jgi:heptosyltransferase-3